MNGALEGLAYPSSPPRAPNRGSEVRAHLQQPVVDQPCVEWPGNVRELENAIESLVAMSHEGTLDLSILPGPARSVPTTSGAGLKDRVDAYERGLIVAALDAAKGNRTEAAQALGIGRATLHDKLKKYGLAGETEPTS